MQSRSTENTSNKIIYTFGAGRAEGHGGMKDILGGKGANLAEMSVLGLQVPPGFTISTAVCTEFYKNDKTLPEYVKDEALNALKKIENEIGKKFGDPSNPLLVSVRSGARASMPGMMDTILNLGLNEKTIEGLAASSNNPRFAWDSYRRFIQMYSNVVMGMNYSMLEMHLEDLKDSKGYTSDTQLTVEELKSLVVQYKRQIFEDLGKKFPEDPFEQLWAAISAVFRSWHTLRAKTYRQLHDIPEEWGTAVNVQSMVFGNLGEDSATGVCFTRNPSTGEKMFYGEFLVNAQGEDVVAGIRTPEPITSLEKIMPECFQQLIQVQDKLENHYKDMQDIEFTIEKGRLWMLQTRNGKRTAKAALRIACDLLDQKLITEEEALMRLDPSSLNQLLHPTLDPKASKNLLTKGLPASPGAASGQIVFTSEEAEELHEKGLKAILVRIETSPEDIKGMIASQGILTTRGGMTSHAAVVARGMGKSCVAGCGEIEVSYAKGEMKVQNKVFQRGDVITLDGATGEVFEGPVETIDADLSGDFERVMKIADKYRRMQVRTNADTPHDSATARRFGAEGIGLCRTEHMFFDADRIDIVRRMIMAESTDERLAALQELLPIQRKDFYEIFQAMDGLPVTIRLLDPPLHEFLPQEEKDQKELSERIRIPLEKLQSRIHSLHEFNPMLGHRGCRLAITYPEIYQMQVRAISEAACQLIKEGKTFTPEIMVPLVSTQKELAILRAQAEEVIKNVCAEMKVEMNYLIGTMIELPRAAVCADEIAESADFFSFGTNDLTQTALGISRDDAGKFLGAYVNAGVFEKDPFVTLEKHGVGKFVKMGVELGRKVKQKLKVGICGEHGGDPASVEFFNSVGLDYVSCSPYRVPIAKLAAAQAAISQRKTGGVGH